MILILGQRFSGHTKCQNLYFSTKGLLYKYVGQIQNQTLTSNQQQYPSISTEKTTLLLFVMSAKSMQIFSSVFCRFGYILVTAMKIRNWILKCANIAKRCIRYTQTAVCAVNFDKCNGLEVLEYHRAPYLTDKWQGYWMHYAMGDAIGVMGKGNQLKKSLVAF